MEDLPGAPAEIADLITGTLVVEGGPGTGKSTALDERVVKLAGAGSELSSIAVITSTALSAETHRSAIEDRLIAPYDEIVAGTWEGFAERLLRIWPVEAGLSPDFEVVGRAERLAMLLVRFEDLPLRHHEIRGDPTGLMKRLVLDLDREKQFGRASAAGEPDEPEPPGGRPFGDDPARRAEFEQLVEFHDRMLADLGCLDGADSCRIAGEMLAGSAPVREAVAADWLPSGD